MKAPEETDLPGLSLRDTLRAQANDYVTKIAWAPNGQLLAVPTQEGNVEIWRQASGEIESTFRVIANRWATNVAWSPNCELIAVGSGDGSTRIWNVPGGFRIKGPKGKTLSLPGSLVAWAPLSSHLATAAFGGVCVVWDTNSWEEVASFKFASQIRDLSCSATGRFAIATTAGDIHISADDPTAIPVPAEYVRQPGVRSLAWSPDSRFLAAGSSHGTVSLFDTKRKFKRTELEGHTHYIRSLSFSSDGRFLASKSDDGKVRIWNLGTSRSVVVPEPTFDRKHFASGKSRPGGLAFHPKAPILATLGNFDRSVRIWNIDIAKLVNSAPGETPIKYMTAKVVLVGDTGVGKTGLGWRLSHGAFKEHSSTHGQQFWLLEQLHTVRSDNTECEAVLWDLAGQADYRLTHALFLDRVDLALILFDPGNHAEPLKGVEYWINALRHTEEVQCPKILLAGRSDRAQPTLTVAELEAFAAKHGITGGFIATSALRGDGIPDLLKRMGEQLSWEAMTTTVTTRTFKRIKEHVLYLKENVGSEILLEPKTLQRKLEETDKGWNFSGEEMMTAVQHLANHGYVSLLGSSPDRQVILLAPEVLSNLAASIVLEARRNLAGLGALEETRLLRGEYNLPELAKLEERDREALLDAVTALFLEHNVCFRERLGATTFLVFPSLINQKKPAEEASMADDVSYVVTGRVENVYASLVVLLGYSNTFTRTNQWQNQAQYEMNPGQICGFRQIAEREGELELIHYYSGGAGQNVRLLFQGLFETFLAARDVTVAKFPPVSCPSCAYHPDRAETVKRIKEHKSFLFCGECGGKIILPAAVTQRPHRAEGSMDSSREQNAARLRTIFEKALAGVKGMLRDKGTLSSKPRCFISYAWGVDSQEKWVLRLAKDLQNADVEVLIDRKDNALIGSSIAEFVNQLGDVSYVVVVGTPEYLSKYENKDPKRGTFVAAEMEILNQRLTGTNADKNSVLPILLEGDKQTAFPPLLRGRVYASFLQQEKYFHGLFDLILVIYKIQVDDPIVFELRQSLWGDA